jgi:hypothetical protein
MADRIIFQNNKAKLKDKEVLRKLEKRSHDADMDSSDSISAFLHTQDEKQKQRIIIYDFHFRCKDNAFSTHISF